MATIYIKLLDPSDTVFIQSILGTYSHLAWVRTENVELGIIKIIPTDDLVEETREVLRNLKKEIEFEEVESGF
jgi:hypothetical protein